MTAIRDDYVTAERGHLNRAETTLGAIRRIDGLIARLA
jgi:hypothetical protein